MIKRTDDEMSIEDAIRHNEEIERREAQEEAQQQNRPSAGKRKRRDIKYLNFVPVSRDTWSLAIARANKEGMKLGEFCGSIIDKAMREPVPQTPDYEIDMIQARTRRHNEWMESLYANVTDYLTHPTEEVAAMLMQQCDRLGVDFKEIVNQAKSDPLSEAARELSSDPNTKTNQCIKWVRQMMEKVDYHILAREANALGVSAGFSKDMLAIARRRLGVQSILDNREYWWVLSGKTRVAMIVLGDDES